MKQHSKAQILTYSGSIIAFHIGSGFSSGQEILQFYSCFGPVGGVGVGVLTFLLQSLFAYMVLTVGAKAPGQSLTDRSLVSQYNLLAGKVLGRLFFLLTPVFQLAILTVTFTGAGQTLYSLFGWPPLWGKALFAVSVLLAVLLGLDGITALSGSIAPLILVCVAVLGGYGICCGASTTLWQKIEHTVPHWWGAACSYAGFGMITQIPFLLAIGDRLKKPAVHRWISVCSSGGFVLAGVLLHTALVRTMPVTLGEQLPALKLAYRISRFFGWFYGIILLFSIFTTAVPLVWSLCHTVQRNENSFGYRVTAVALTAALVLQNRLSFERLLAVLYPYIGYVALVFFGAAALRRVCLGRRGRPCAA